MKEWLLILLLSFGCIKHSIKSEKDKTTPEEVKTDTLEEGVPSKIYPMPESSPPMERNKQVNMRAGSKVRKALIRESIVLPEYPNWVREKGLPPVFVRLRLFVTSSGDIRTVIIERSSGFLQWDKSVAATVKKWKCEPTMDTWDDWIEFLFKPY